MSMLRHEKKLQGFEPPCAEMPEISPERKRIRNHKPVIVPALNGKLCLKPQPKIRKNEL